MAVQCSPFSSSTPGEAAHASQRMGRGALDWKVQSANGSGHSREGGEQCSAMQSCHVR